MKTEHPENNYFQSLQVFENDTINKAIDSVYSLVVGNFGNINDQLSVCGSVAKIMDGLLPENYEPKDIDLVVKSPIVWRFLEVNIQKINPLSFEKQERRMILYFQDCCIEIWKMMEEDKKKGIFKNKIYYCYAN